MQDKGLYNAGSLGIESALSTNKVLKNTYMLLGMTLLFSAATAGLSMAMGLPQGAALILMLVGFGLLFVVNRTADSSKGIVAIFAFIGRYNHPKRWVLLYKRRDCGPKDGQ